jgi:hypothetical protein
MFIRTCISIYLSLSLTGDIVIINASVYVTFTACLQLTQEVRYTKSVLTVYDLCIEYLGPENGEMKNVSFFRGRGI